MSVARSIIAGVDGFDRWGFANGKGALISKIYGTKVIIELLKRFIDGELSAQETSSMMNKKVRALE
jgi:multiple sugar transport system substrate-binding protein